MKKSALCYGCIYCKECDKTQEEKCRERGYMLFTTDADKAMCDLMCGEAEEENDDN